VVRTARMVREVVLKANRHPRRTNGCVSPTNQKLPLELERTRLMMTRRARGEAWGPSRAIE